MQSAKRINGHYYSHLGDTPIRRHWFVPTWSHPGLPWRDPVLDFADWRGR